MKNSQCYFIVWALLAIATPLQGSRITSMLIGMAAAGFLVAAMYELSKEPK